MATAGMPSGITEILNKLDSLDKKITRLEASSGAGTGVGGTTNLNAAINAINDRLNKFNDNFINLSVQVKTLSDAVTNAFSRTSSSKSGGESKTSARNKSKEWSADRTGVNASRAQTDTGDVYTEQASDALKGFASFIEKSLDDIMAALHRDYVSYAYVVNAVTKLIEENVGKEEFAMMQDTIAKLFIEHSAVKDLRLAIETMTTELGRVNQIQHVSREERKKYFKMYDITREHLRNESGRLAELVFLFKSDYYYHKMHQLVIRPVLDSIAASPLYQMLEQTVGPLVKSLSNNVIGNAVRSIIASVWKLAGPIMVAVGPGSLFESAFKFMKNTTTTLIRVGGAITSVFKRRSAADGGEEPPPGSGEGDKTSSDETESPEDEKKKKENEEGDEGTSLFSKLSNQINNIFSTKFIPKLATLSAATAATYGLLSFLVGAHAPGAAKIGLAGTGTASGTSPFDFLALALLAALTGTAGKATKGGKSLISNIASASRKRYDELKKIITGRKKTAEEKEEEEKDKKETQSKFSAQINGITSAIKKALQPIIAVVGLGAIMFYTLGGALKQTSALLTNTLKGLGQLIASIGVGVGTILSAPFEGVGRGIGSVVESFGTGAAAAVNATANLVSAVIGNQTLNNAEDIISFTAQQFKQLNGSLTTVNANYATLIAHGSSELPASSSTPTNTSVEKEIKMLNNNIVTLIKLLKRAEETSEENTNNPLEKILRRVGH